ncbi:DUF3737 family protein [Helicobacter sp. MIT 11-5569]|uniref:DUF3737 family protein n=1 Tax=Helicobacter sp. MIT 11-5569 TaxID=1548151 RepID=UPI00051FDCE0|nr:DUF3737 family protein [Helicobacter sp. MIT 11-5569]TLD83296.1 DUF3737 family protein [Helicobacter sp. MIT 11-5569]
MKIVCNQEFTGERALYHQSDLEINDSNFFDGESPLKESKNIIINHSSFAWKYPLWYCEDITCNNTIFKETARSGIWYVDNIKIYDSNIEAPKLFRRSSHIEITDSNMLNGLEAFWNCSDIKIKNMNTKGDYMFFNSKNIELDNFQLDGNYVFDGAKNIVVKNSILDSKDSFWNTENVIVENSQIIGEYIAWNAKNITFINCTIESMQGFCYTQNLKLIDCKLLNTNLAFEFSSVEAKINSKVDSIKNPMSGKIECLGCDVIIFDGMTDKSKTEIIINGKKYE